MSAGALPPVETVAEAARAELLLHPLRQTILTEAREPSSASEIARRVGRKAQQVNYHVRALVDAGFLLPAGERRKRNLIEKRYRASAEAYVLLPRVLGDVGPASVSDADRFGAAHLMGLSAQLQEELGAWFGPGAAATSTEGPEGGLVGGSAGAVGRPIEVPTLSLDAELRFESADQRAAFASALRHAVERVIAEHASPMHAGQGEEGAGRPYRLVVGCYPIRDSAVPGRVSGDGPGNAVDRSAPADVPADDRRAAVDSPGAPRTDRPSAE